MEFLARIMANASGYRDFNFLDLDPFQEVSGTLIRRKKDRRQQMIPVSRVTFIPSLFIVIDCIIPTCNGHQKFGVVTSENVPVIFKCHDFNEEAMYIAYKNPLCRPLRVPLDGDYLINGIKWRMKNTNIHLPTLQTLFDCLFAALKFQTLTLQFCLECLFRHLNGEGLNLERFLKTVMSHIVVMGRFFERESFIPVIRYQKGMDFKMRRVYWQRRDEMFKICCIVSRRNGVKKEAFYSALSEVNAELPNVPSYGAYGNPDVLFLKNLDSISAIHVNVQCFCFNKRSIPQLAYVGVVRQTKSGDFINIALARWEQAGNEYSDPLLNWCLFGPENPNRTAIDRTSAIPLSSVCNKCKTVSLLKNIYVPPTTWLFMAEIPPTLQKVPVDQFLAVESFVIGDVAFELKFVLIYNTVSGSFTSLNYYDGQWFFLDDKAGGLMKRCYPDRVKYKERINLRLFYFRKTNAIPHQCLLDAAERL